MSTDEEICAQVVLKAKVEALAAYQGGGGGGGSGGGVAPFALLQDLLQYIDEKKIRASQLIVQYGYQLATSYSSKLGHKVWDLYERVFVAALDCCQSDVREACIRALSKKFPGSDRVRVLYGMLLESQGEYAAAAGEYKGVLGDDPANMAASKRLVALLKARGEVPKAIHQLTTYVKVFSSDLNAWQELNDLYISVGKYELAKFCQEEILLIQPDNYLNHLQYAELMYTIGADDSVTYARQYYAQSLELKPEGNLRALFGLLLCLRQGGSSKPVHTELRQWGAAKVLAAYKVAAATNPNPYLQDIVDAALQT